MGVEPASGSGLPPGKSSPSREGKPVAVSPSRSLQIVHASIAWGVFALCFAMALAYVARNSVNVPFGDDWDELRWTTGRFPITLSWLWTQHNEHRVPLSRLILTAAFWLSGHDFRAGCHVVLLMLATLAAALLVLAQRLRGRYLWTDAIFPLTLLHLGHCDNYLGAFQVQFAGSALFPGLMLVGVAWRTEPPRKFGELAFLAVCSISLCGFGASSLVYAPPMAVWLAYAGCLNWNSGFRTAAISLFATAATTLAIVGWYFVGLQQVGLPGTFGDALNVGLQFLTMGIYPYPMRYWPQVGWIVPPLLLVAGFILGRAFCKLPAERLRVAGMLLFLAGFVTLAAGIGWGRRGLGTQAGCQARYATLAAVSVTLTYLATILYAKPARRLSFQAGLCLLMAVAYWPHYEVGEEWANTRTLYCREFERDVRQGIRAAVLGDNYSSDSRTRFKMWSHPRADVIAENTLMLRELGYGPFHPSKDDGAARIVGWNLEGISAEGGEWRAADATGRAFKLNDGLNLPLPKSQFVQRMYLQLQINETAQAQVPVRIEAVMPQGPPLLVWQGNLHKMPEPWLLSLPVDAEASHLRIKFGAGPCEYRVGGISLLVGMPGLQ